MRPIWLTAITLLMVLALASAAQSAEPKPFGHSCGAQNGVRFCPTADSTSRVPSWDGVPLDADVTLPASGEGPFPTIVLIHGWGGSKSDFESDNPDGSGASTYHYNNNYYAKHGYAVLTYTARGFGNSCGKKDLSTPICYATGHGGYIHLKDQRIEAHDTQYLLGLLVDEGIANPSALGASGISYGGGESIELAFLRDKTRNTDGTLSPWKSPNGTPLSLAAAWPRWPWSDLVYSLLPNGRSLDFRVEPAAGVSRNPVGVPIETYIEGLFATGNTSGNYAPPGLDPTADLVDWHTRVNAGEPYADPYVRSVVNEIYNFHSGIGLRLAQGASTPAALLIQNGWTDDLFPPMEALRIYNVLRAANPNAPVSLQFGDLGHARGQNKAKVSDYTNDQGAAFLGRYLQGSDTSQAPAPGSVTAFTQTCPKTAPDGGPYTAGSWRALHPGAFRFAKARSQTVTSAGGNPQTGKAIDPIAGGGACAQVAKETAPGTAVVESPASSGYTLMGLPTVQADIVTTGLSGQLDSRLWDVAPDGQQTLISRGTYRLTDNQSGRVVFQLHGNGWYFAPGHVAKLELLGNDAPYLRPSNTQFQVQVANVVVELPTLEPPASAAALSPSPTVAADAGGQTVQPLLGQGQVFSVRSIHQGTPRLRLTIKPAKARVHKRTRFRACVRAWVGGKLVRVRRATVSFLGKRAKSGRNGCTRLTVRPRRTGKQRARVRKPGYRAGAAVVRVGR